MQKVKMIKTLSKKIPNGSIGIVNGSDIRKPGLHLVEFSCGYAAYVYNHEVEELKDE